MKVAIENLDLSLSEKTYLTADYSSGTTLTVRNSEGMTADWFVVVGEPGQEQTESRRVVASPTNTTVTIDSALRFSHTKSCPVYLSQFDTWSFESKPLAGSFAAISGSPFNIEWDDRERTTTIVVSGGVTTDTYRWRPFNSYTGTYGTYSDELPGTGLARTIAGYAIETIKRNPVARSLDDDVLYEFFNDFQELVYDEIPNAWFFKKEGTALTLTLNDYSYSITANWSDFVSMEYLLFEYINGSNDITYPLSFTPLAEFYNLKADASQPTDDNAQKWTLLPPDSTSPLGYIGIHPTPKTSACKLKPVYQYKLPEITSFGDSLIVPKTKGYVDYALYRIYDDIKGDASNADKYNSRVKSTILSLKRRTRRQIGQKQLFRFRGHRGFSRNFGEQGKIDISTYRENYW